jgi:large subunit ribosomal protein L21
MYAIVKTGGKQYRVEEGRSLDVELLPAEEGATVELVDVLLIAEDGTVTVGTPTIEGARVLAHVDRHGRAKKIIVFTYKNKVRTRSKTGHRQWFTRLTVEDILRPGEEAKAKPKPARQAKAADEPEAEVPEAAAEAPAEPVAEAPVIEEAPKRRTRAAPEAEKVRSTKAEKSRPAKAEKVRPAKAEKEKPKRAPRGKAEKEKPKRAPRGKAAPAKDEKKTTTRRRFIGRKKKE